LRQFTQTIQEKKFVYSYISNGIIINSSVITYLWQVGGFLWLPPPIKLTATI